MTWSAPLYSRPHIGGPLGISVKVGMMFNPGLLPALSMPSDSASSTEPGSSRLEALLHKILHEHRRDGVLTELLLLQQLQHPQGWAWVSTYGTVSKVGWATG